MAYVTAFFFYLFATISVFSAVMVVVSRNPVHSVLYLILTFFNAAGLFVLLGAEFLAMILLVVYIGAVAVLFLFVVMMLDIDFAELRKGALKCLPIGLVVGFILLFEILLVVGGYFINANEVDVANKMANYSDVTNTEQLGMILYTKYVYFFQSAGLILLVAMIGAIVLTMRHRPNVKRQVISEQVARDPDDAVRLVNVKPGQGI